MAILRAIIRRSLVFSGVLCISVSLALWGGTSLAGEPDADVISVKLTKQGRDKWTFYVTVQHPDTGWEDYCNGWDIVTPDGMVVKNDPDDPFTRLLLHPHEHEQPFTRSQTVEIPREITHVTVRAHDIVDGFGGKEVEVALPH